MVLTNARKKKLAVNEVNNPTAFVHFSELFVEAVNMDMYACFLGARKNKISNGYNEVNKRNLKIMNEKYDTNKCTK